jgi:ribosome biogenesis GTPase / thiamine phosphate phosphatase
MTTAVGTVYYGINNIYTVRMDDHSDQELECRIKGKVLEIEGDAYNPIAPGDRVEIETAPDLPGRGMILRRLDRRNAFRRWNRKRNAPQTVCVNVDRIVCVTTPRNPPFRPRFIDRVLVSAAPDIPVHLLVNKVDLELDQSTGERLEDYLRIGYSYDFCSARTGEGIESLRTLLSGRRTAFVGQSGVGKSSVLNRLYPELGLREGEISLKHDRGRHTTNYAVMIDVEGATIIDTPGIREIEVCGIEPEDLWSYFPEIAELSTGCAFSQCLHMGEPDCAVRSGLKQGRIHPDRYESYARLLEDLRSRNEYAYM